jgi:hypothetical protein
MGAKAWFIAYFDQPPTETLALKPQLDRDASRRLAERLFPGATLTPIDDGTLDYLNPDDGQIFVGCYAGLTVVAHSDLGIDFPAKLDRRWLDVSLGRTAYLHATHSVVDWLAFALWRDGALIRALSLSPDNGVQENLGVLLAFEEPFWNGQHPVDAEYPLPFHPLELSEASLLQHMGFQFEGMPSAWVCEPSEIPLARFSIR